MKKPSVSFKTVVDYFGLRLRTARSLHNKINLIKLYHSFIELKTMREQKRYLYSYKKKNNEDVLDHIWSRYVERIYQEREIKDERRYIEEKRKELHNYQLSI